MIEFARENGLNDNMEYTYLIGYMIDLLHRKIGLLIEKKTIFRPGNNISIVFFI